MRTLKKTLCLVLALALCFSLASVAFASNLDSYTDAESVTYTEAVDVLMGMGIVKGDTETTINPQGDLTREQAAKLVTYAALGGTVADKLSATSDPFTDVAATRWSAGYISYCVSAGIINGDGNGKFRPTDNVTGYEFAKMMLCVLGYGKADEYTGKSWSVNVAKDALSANINLFKGVLTAASNEAINREEAFQVVFNTLTIPDSVVYSKDTESYKDDEAKTKLGYDVFGLDSVGATDDNGRVGHKWQANGKDVSETYTNAATFTFTSAQTEAALKKTLKGYDFPEDADEDLDTLAELAALTGNGVLVEVYTNADKEIIDVVVVEEVLAQVDDVTDADEEAETDRYITIGENDYTTESFAEEDYVLYTLDATGTAIASVIAAPSVQGNVTATGDGYIRIDGTKYEIHNGVDVSGLNFTATYTFYLDSYGYIIGYAVVTPGETTLNYVYVAESASTVKGESAFSTAVDSAKLSIVNVDGTTAVVNLAISTATAAKDGYAKGDPIYYNPTTSAYAKLTASDSLVPAGFYSYTVNSDGAYTLKALVATKAAELQDEEAVTVVKNTASVGIDGKVANSKTVLTVINNGAATTYTGIANFPAESTTFVVDDAEKGETQVTGLLYIYTGSVISQIIVIGGDVNVADDPAVYAVYLGQGETTTAGTVHKFLLTDGTTKEYTDSEEHAIAFSDGLAAGEVCTLTVNSGYLTNADEVTGTEAGTVSVLDDTFFVATNGTYYYASSYVIFDLTGKAPAVATSIKKDNVVTVENGTGTDSSKVALIVITG
jgi:hypothetical protein